MTPPCLPPGVHPCPPVHHHHPILGRARHTGRVGCPKPKPVDCAAPAAGAPLPDLPTTAGGALGAALPAAGIIGGGFVGGIGLGASGALGSGYGFGGGGGHTAPTPPKHTTCPAGDIGTPPHCYKPTPIPEPVSMGLLVVGMFMVFYINRLHADIRRMRCTYRGY